MCVAATSRQAKLHLLCNTSSYQTSVLIIQLKSGEWRATCTAATYSQVSNKFSNHRSAVRSSLLRREACTRQEIVVCAAVLVARLN